VKTLEPTGYKTKGLSATPVDEAGFVFKSSRDGFGVSEQEIGEQEIISRTHDVSETKGRLICSF